MRATEKTQKYQRYHCFEKWTTVPTWEMMWFEKHIISQLKRHRSTRGTTVLRSNCTDLGDDVVREGLQGKQGVQGAYALVRGGSSASNLLEPIISEITRCIEFFHMSLGWFNCTEPSHNV